MRLPLIVTCDNCVSESKLSPDFSLPIWEEKEKNLSLKNIPESASDSTKNKIPNNQTLRCTGRGLPNNSKHFTKSKLTVKP